jgi:hypothetical protein
MDDTQRKTHLERVTLYASQQSGPLGAALAAIAEALLSVLARMAVLEAQAQHASKSESKADVSKTKTKAR